MCLSILEHLYIISFYIFLLILFQNRLCGVTTYFNKFIYLFIYWKKLGRHIGGLNLWISFL